MERKENTEENEFTMNYSNNGLCKASRVLLWRQSAHLELVEYLTDLLETGILRSKEMHEM